MAENPYSASRVTGGHRYIVGHHSSVGVPMDTICSCKAGSFKGFSESGCIHFRGIRYASSERYHRPVPYIYPEGVHECFEPSPYCVQDEARIEGRLLGIYYGNQKQVESCQFLSIAIPEDADRDSKLPVMVWYHGGSYKNGGCENDIYDRGFLAKEQNVIVVGVNYRLGVTGLVRDEKGDLSNNALLDAIEGLRWVKENISSFGGDADNITVFGQSAGADIVRCMLISEDTDGLFVRGILQSPPIGTMVNRQDMDRQVLDELNSHPVDAPVEELIETQEHILGIIDEKSYAKEMVFAPHYGIYPLPKEEDIRESFRIAAGKYPILIGSNSREVMAYVAGEGKMIKLWKIIPLRPIIRKKADEASRGIFIAPIRRFAEEYASYGGTVYHYNFHWAEDTLIGSCHGCELPLLFGPRGYSGTLEKKISMDRTELERLGRPLRDIWAGFARDGTVSSFKVPEMMDIEKL